MSRYTELINQHPELVDCFFAFSNEQCARGLKEHNLKREDVYNGGAGLCGTKEGIAKVKAFYDNIYKQIAIECDPQEVYNYELSNHEGNDEEAYKIVTDIFGEDVNVERKY